MLAVLGNAQHSYADLAISLLLLVTTTDNAVTQMQGNVAILLYRNCQKRRCVRSHILYGTITFTPFTYMKLSCD